MKTKNYEMEFGSYCDWPDWALPLRINIENFANEHFEIYLQILCFHFSFTRMSHKYVAKLNAMFEKIRSDND